MPGPHTTEPHGDGYVNPEVQFERSDVDSKSVVQFGAGLAVLVVGSVVAMWLLLRLVSRLDEGRKEGDLPPAAVDREQGLPPIPLEGIEDVREGRPRLYPPRAAEYAAPREKQLREGGAGALPIEAAISALAEPEKKGAPPRTYMIRLPSRASSGRTDTGGQ